MTLTVPKNILIFGASGGIGRALIEELILYGCSIGAHCNENQNFLESVINKAPTTPDHIIIQRSLKDELDAQYVLQKYLDWRNQIDAVVILVGGISNPVHWSLLPEDNWKNDLNLNLSIPFFIAREAVNMMIPRKKGHIIMMSTESALHGGGATSLAYGVAKAGIECLVKGLARDCALNGIRINGIRPGYIRSGFHERWKNSDNHEYQKRISKIPLQRAGRPDEVAKAIIFTLSSWNTYMTGELISISGGDYL